ncbi:MAG: hypothetical protein JW963_24595, partial [Anaerolineales bacterium]|nr:hypothetical protein [Anaerolineales bacterium]
MFRAGFARPEHSKPHSFTNSDFILPKMMHQRANAPVVEGADGVHRRGSKRGQVGGADVVFGL